MGGFGFSYNLGNFNMNGRHPGNNNMLIFGFIIFFIFIANFFFSAENQYVYPTNPHPKHTINQNRNQFRMNDDIGRRGRSQEDDPYGYNSGRMNAQTEFGYEWLWNFGVVILFFVILFLSKYLKSSNN